MAPQYDGYDQSDGISQLTEIMRGERLPEPTRETEPVDPIVRRTRRRRTLIIRLVVAVVVAALLGSYVAFTLTAPVGSGSAEAKTPQVHTPEAAALAMSPEGASAISVAGGSDYLPAAAAGIWATSGGDTPRPIASISKLISAMVVLSVKPLNGADDPGPTITFDKGDHKLYDKYYVLGATIAPMPTGSHMSEHDALETMLVVSACNYSESVTDWAFGTQDAFVAATKKWLAANGMTHTTMVESTGIDARNQSTTSDLIALGKLAMANPAIAKIVAMPNTNIAGFDSMSTTNDLLGTAGVNGIKTGNLLDTGYNLLYSAIVPAGKAGDLTVIGVVLGGGSRESVDNDVKGMIASVSGGFHEVELGKAGDQVGTYSTPWGKTSPLVLRAGAQVFTWSDTPITAKLSTSALRTGQAGEKVGSISWTSGKNTVIVDVVLQRAITQPSPGWRLTHPFELGK